MTGIKTSSEPVHVVGAGLAGSEAAWQVAKTGAHVVLHEMRPERMTEAHRTDGLAELVCSNSFRSDDAANNAVGLLHAEMRRLGSLIMRSADANQVPAGGALAVDRDGFSAAVTKALQDHPLIEIRRAEIAGLPPADWRNVIVATGPLTSAPLADAIRELTDENALAFFDAIAPIVHRDSIDMSAAWFQSRYDKVGPGGTGADYINCPMSKEQYDGFVAALISGEKTEFKEWETNTPYFDGCLPIEVMAERGPETLRHGPMKPVGLTNSHNPAVKAYAIVQLRQDNKLGTLYNMVGFQTKLKHGAQQRVFRTIPGLENAEFARLGGLHRNTFLNSPKLLDSQLRLRADPRLRFAGQMTGCEGYVESAAIGLISGVGPDVKLHLGEWGEAQIKYYYQNDNRANYSTNAFPAFGNIPQNRQRFFADWQATPATNLNLKALVNYQSDPLFLHDFFVSAYTENPQPDTFVEANKYWDNWSLDTLTTPRVNSFFSQVERLPDVQLTGYRQQLWDTPIYYDSQSSIGWYRAWDANATNGLYPGTNGFYVASATRADTFHQLSMPWTFFDWLNVTPRVGGRLTYYGSQNFTNGQPNSDVYREVFNTGVGVSFKASQLWTDATNSFLDVDGLRHIIEPSANYVFVPDPSTPPAQLPPFDSDIPSLMLSPVNFPDYNSIDSIDTMNVIRFGVRNVLQTKRDGQLDDLVNWNVMMDWRLDPTSSQTTLNDLYSAFSFRPRPWLTAESQLRYNLDSGDLNLAFHQLTFAPGDRWSWSVGHWYLRSGFVSPDEDNFITSIFYYKLNENYGFRVGHTFNATDGRLQEQDYTIMRDLRSWTAALSFRLANNLGSSADFTVAFSFSFKAIPSTQVGEDAVSSYHLVGQ